MAEIKSVRIRKLVKGSNTGNLDLKVTLTSGSASNTQRFVKATVPTTGQIYWSETQFSGQRYDSKSNDEILQEFISSNSAREITRLGLPSSKTLYRILQDPWTDEPPVLRNFGEDPYYLNNGATVKIDWKRFMMASYSFSPYYVYGDGTQSSPTQIVVISDVTLDGKQPENYEIDYPTEFRLFYSVGTFSLTSSVSDATQEANTRGFSNSFKNRNYFLETNDGYSFNDVFGQYVQQPEDDFYFPPVGPSQVSEYVSGFEFSDVNLKEINTPNNIFKEVTIIPRRIKPEDEGDIIEERRAWTFNSQFKPDFVYNFQESTATNSNSRYRFNSDVKDETIVAKTIETWIKELSLVYPEGKNYSLKLSEPIWKKPTENLIADYSPINGWGLDGDTNIFPKGTQFKFQIGGSNSNVIVPLGGTGVTAGSQSIVASTASQVEKIKMKTVFPENWIVRADEKAETFSLWVGDIENDIPPEGFIYSEEVDDLSGLSPEYVEAEFEGDSEAPPELEEIEPELNFVIDISIEVSFTPASSGSGGEYTPGTIVSLPETYSHTKEQGYNLLNSQWIGDLITSAKSHIKTPTYDIADTEKGNKGCASAVSIMFYRAFGVHLQTGKPVKDKPQDIGSFGTKGTGDAAAWFENTSLYKKITWTDAQPGDIINTARNGKVAGHIGVVIDEKAKDGTWAIVSNSSKGFAGGGGGAVKQNYSIKSWSSVEKRNPSQTAAYRYIGPKLKSTNNNNNSNNNPNKNENTTPSGSLFIVGDSIASGIAGRVGDVGVKKSDNRGISQVGANAKIILGFLKELGSKLKGNTVILSTGLTNGKDYTDVVKQQLEYLKGLNAKVYIVGVADPDPEKVPGLAGRNKDLQNYAKQYGATYLGSFKSSDKYGHPNYQSYKDTKIKPLGLKV